MHRCLHSPEILRLTCEELRLQQEPVATLTLSNLARTCREFSEPALNSLWYEIQGLQPLVMCLPGNAWTVSNKGLLHLSRALAPVDFERLSMYTRRVQILYIEKGRYRNCSRTSLPVYAVLSAFSRGCLLPTLREMHWVGSTDDNAAFEYLHMFLSPVLRCLTINFHGPINNPRNTSILNSLSFAGCNQTLRHLALASTSQVISLDILEGLITEWQNLSVLDLPDVSVKGFLQIAQMPNLERLVLRLGYSSSNSLSEEDFDRSTIESPFTSLKSLSLLQISLAAAMNIIPWLEDVDLQSLSFDILSDSSLEDNELLWTSFYEYLGRYCNPATLTELHITHGGSGPDNLPFLLQFPCLEHVQLNIADGVYISPELAVRIPGAWINLRSLDILPFISSANQQNTQNIVGTSLQALAILAEGCNNLESLSLYVDGRPNKVTKATFNMLDYLKTSPIISNKLVTLDVGRSPITQDDLVVVFLSEIFPKLRQLKYDPRGRDVRHWSRVSDVGLQSVAIVRSRERQRLIGVSEA